MTSTISLAFLHHAAAFLLVAVVMVELVVMRNELTLSSARSLVRMDAVYGVAAFVVLVVGFLRVVYTEKGTAYYFASGTFVAKIALFAIVGLLSMYPTIRFLSWRKALRQQQLPALTSDTQRRIRMILHIELTLLFGMMLCAAMMARGIGFLG
jgi:putative membrane protein